MEHPSGIMPKIAELIQQDFDAKWFSDPAIRTVKAPMLDAIRHGLSPFKAELAAFIEEQSVLNNDYAEEINKLSEISKKSISGVITTNYDLFLENHFHGYAKYVGQKELIFSTIQGIAEIYKIHGSLEVPDSIVINEQDYLQFQENSSYLAAKLMTIFMEYPIIFLGYSISDNNILSIIKSIVNCLDRPQVELLEHRFIFVEYDPGITDIRITPYTIMIDGKPLTMSKIVLKDFLPLYSALENKRAKLPVRILRHFKQELYNYTLTNAPTASLRVAAIDDTRINDEDLVLAIGKVSELGLKGLSGIDSNEWYRNIILDNLEFSSDELLEYAFPKLMRQNSGRLPIHKYLSSATKSFPECQRLAKEQTFDTIISKTIRKNRKCLGNLSSVRQIWEQEQRSLERATRLISHLTEEQIDISELEAVLKQLFENDINILQTVDANTRTNIRRLIMIYDYLKWGR